MRDEVSSRAMAVGALRAQRLLKLARAAETLGRSVHRPPRRRTRAPLPSPPISTQHGWSDGVPPWCHFKVDAAPQRGRC